MADDMRRRDVLAGTVLATTLACRPRPDANTPRIAVIPKGTTHEFWKSVHAGARSAAQALKANAELIWKGPLREDDREQQVQVVEGFVAQGVRGMVLAPLDARALTRPVEEGHRMGIPTVVIDSALATDEIVSFVATDNEHGGALAARRLGALLGGKGSVIMLRYQQGSASTEAREKGFLDTFERELGGLRLVSSEEHAGATRDSAKRAAENLLNRHGADLRGVFCSCEPTTMGMLLALEDLGLAGRVSLVGFDVTPGLLAALRAGRIHGLVVQNPFQMGETGVRVLWDHLNGRKVPRLVHTDVALVTRDNLDDPKIRALVLPPQA